MIIAKKKKKKLHHDASTGGWRDHGPSTGVEKRCAVGARLGSGWMGGWVPGGWESVCPVCTGGRVSWVLGVLMGGCLVLE